MFEEGYTSVHYVHINLISLLFILFIYTVLNNYTYQFKKSIGHFFPVVSVTE